MTDSALSREAFEATSALAERFMMISADGPMKYAVGGFYALLLTEAAACATRAQQAALAGDPKTEVGASASAVLAAAAACETYLSEFLACAEMFRVLNASTTAGIRGERDAQQQWKELIKARGVQFDVKTSAEYAQVGCLFHLRNHIAHRNSRLDIQDSWPERLRECVVWLALAP